MTTAPPVPDVLTLAETATYLRISERHCRALATAELIPSYRWTESGQRFVRLDDLRAVIAKRVAEQMAALPNPFDPVSST